MIKVGGRYFSFNIFCQATASIYNKSKLDFRILIQRYTQFTFMKRYGTSFSTNFCMIFQKKYFSCSVLLTDHVSRSHSLIAFDSKMLGNLCIVIFCCPICDVTNFEINLSFLIKTFFYILAKKSGQKGKYFQKEKSF